MILYSITNSISGKEYIGATIRSSLGNRISKHKCSSKKGSTYPLHTDIRELGFDKFVVKELEKFSNKEELYEAEKKAIAERKNLYNLTIGGKGIPGFKYSKQIREKISKALMGRIVSQETRDYLSKLHKGKSYHPGPVGIKRSEETKRKISLNHGRGMLGKKQTEEAKKIFLEKRLLLIANEGFGKLFPRMYPEIKKLKEEGLSSPQIAKRYNCTGSAIRYFMKRMLKSEI